MPDLYLLAISIKDFQELGMELSDPIKASLPLAIQRLKELVQTVKN